MSLGVMEKIKKGVPTAILSRSLLPQPGAKFPQNTVDRSTPETRSLPVTDINTNLGHDFGRISVMPTKSPDDSTGFQPVSQTCPLGVVNPRACPFGGACHTCPVRIQTKLASSQLGDVYEQEADRVVEQVMQMPGLKLQRYAARPTGSDVVPPIFHEVLSSSGQPLDPETRSFMEARFRHNFSRVRVHTDTMASESAQAINALAYTIGRDIVFGPGQYTPHTTTGQRLMSHELTHVVQQRELMSSGDLKIASTCDQYEREAERSAAGLSSMSQVSRAPVGMVQRQFVTPLAAGGGFGGLMERDRRRVASGEPTEEEKTYNSALEFAKSLETKYPGWCNVLPDCPCTVDKARTSSEFKEDSWLTTIVLDWGGYHLGAADSFRTKKGYQSKPGTSHGQQCIYDGKGRLITDGPGAGTPDLWSPETNYNEHQEFDVKPFKSLGWQTYNRYWVPNKGISCSPNDGKKKD